MNKLFQTRRGNRLLIFIIIAVGGFAMLGLRLYGSLFPCPFHIATGMNCPGCGGTRALYALMRLDFLTAFYYNPLIVIITLFFIIWMLWFVKNTFIGEYKQPFQSKYYAVFGFSLAAVTIAFWIVRNTGYYKSIFY